MPEAEGPCPSLWGDVSHEQEQDLGSQLFWQGLNTRPRNSLFSQGLNDLINEALSCKTLGALRALA